jgi:hypothetical protein
MLEMVMEDHKTDVKAFADEALNAWSPFFIQTMKAPMPPPPNEDDEKKEGGPEEQWRGLIALKFQVVKVSRLSNSNVSGELTGSIRH